MTKSKTVNKQVQAPLTRQRFFNEGTEYILVRGPQSETLPPPSGIFADMHQLKAPPKSI